MEVSIGVLVSNYSKIRALEQIPLSLLSGSDAIKLRSILKRIRQVVMDFQQMRQDYITENADAHDENGNAQIQDSNKQEIAKEWFSEALNETIEVNWEALETSKILSAIGEIDTNLTLSDIDMFESIGILQES